MPRKYHRPPDTTKRRKPRKTSIPQAGAGEAPEERSDAPESENGTLEAPITAVSVADPEPEAEDSPRLRGILRSAATPGATERHVGRDYSYVLGDVVRIAAIATFLLVSLVVTAILRN